jgi:diaminohydroxyphosphoribosylaminopyrimidine deaminase/5-amino-6-(5-phosphoribosylamino)uracil reductase
VWELPERAGGVDVAAVLRRLGAAGCLHAVCEGGGELAASLVRAGLVDEYWFFVAPRLLGASGVAAIGGRGWPLGTAPALRIVGCERVGADVLIRARPAGRGR